MKAADSLFTYDFFIVSVLSLIVRFSMFIRMTLQPLYILELEYSKTVTGLAMTIFTIAALVLRPAAGRAIDRYGRRSIFFLGTIIFTVTTFPFGFTGRLTVLIVFQTFSGIGFSMQSVASTTMVTDIVPESKLTKGLGYYGLTATLAQAVGPAAALFLLKNTGYKTSFIITGIISFLAIIIGTLVNYEKNCEYKYEPEPRQTDEKGKFINKIIEKSAAYPSLFLCLIAFASASVGTFLVPFAQEAGIQSIALFYTVRAVGIGVSRLIAGKVTDVFGNFNILIFGMITICTGTAGIIFIRDINFLLIFAFLYGIGFGFTVLLLNVAAVIRTPKHRRAAANATYYLAMDAGIGIGAVTWGIVGDAFGLGSIFCGATIISLAAFVFFILLRKSRTILD